jgi:hypothetical protein
VAGQWAWPKNNEKLRAKRKEKKKNWSIGLLTPTSQLSEKKNRERSVCRRQQWDRGGTHGRRESRGRNADRTTYDGGVSGTPRRTASSRDRVRPGRAVGSGGCAASRAPSVPWAQMGLKRFYHSTLSPLRVRPHGAGVGQSAATRGGSGRGLAKHAGGRRPSRWSAPAAFDVSNVAHTIAARSVIGDVHSSHDYDA